MPDNRTYEQQVEDAIGMDSAGWSSADQSILDQIRNGEISVNDSRAVALWRWCQHNAVNHADGRIGEIADELKVKGVIGDEPPHLWPGT